MEQKREYINVNGIRTFYIKIGNGDPVVLIHGASPGGSSQINWKLNIEPLAYGGFSVYAYDQPGFGHTDNPSDYSIEYAVGHAKALMTSLNLEHFHVVGNSVGGYIAARLALEDDRVKSFVTTASGTLAPDGSAESQLLYKKHLNELQEFKPSIENMKKLTLGTIFNKDLVTDDLVRDRYEMSIGKNYEAQLHRRKAQKQKPVHDDMSKLRVKALLVWGNNDRGVSIERGVQLFRQIPGAEFHIFDKCGHWPQWDHAKRFNQLLIDFLKE
jgi:pimeloyl-ACP methyl ester carboxylesterase